MTPQIRRFKNIFT